MSRPGLRWYTAIRPTLSRSKRGSKAGQPLTAADVALCTRHRPVRRIASIAPREGSVAPGFCSPSVHHHQHSRAGQGQRRAARRGAELTRATLFVENGGDCSLPVAESCAASATKSDRTVRGPASAEPRAAAACRAARPERRRTAQGNLGPQGPAQCQTRPRGVPALPGCVSIVQFLASSAVGLRDQQGKMLRTQSLVVTGSISCQQRRRSPVFCSKKNGMSEMKGGSVGERGKKKMGKRGYLPSHPCCRCQRRHDTWLRRRNEVASSTTPGFGGSLVTSTEQLTSGKRWRGSLSRGRGIQTSASR